MSWSETSNKTLSIDISNGQMLYLAEIPFPSFSGISCAIFRNFNGQNLIAVYNHYETQIYNILENVWIQGMSNIILGPIIYKSI